MLIHVTLGACTLMAALLVLRYDLHARKPWALLAITAALGGGTMAVLGRAEDLFIFWVTSLPPCWFVSVVAATFEEGAKLGLVAAVSVAFRRHGRDPVDGLVLGSIAGLGMAVWESTDYLRRFHGEAVTFPAPEILRLLGHLVLGGIGGYGIGLACTGFAHAWRVVAGGLSAAILLHFVADWASLQCVALPRLPWVSVVAFMAAMVGGILIFGSFVTHASDLAPRGAGRPPSRTLLRWPLTLLSKPRERAPANGRSEAGSPDGRRPGP